MHRVSLRAPLPSPFPLLVRLPIARQRRRFSRFHETLPVSASAIPVPLQRFCPDTATQSSVSCRRCLPRRPVTLSSSSISAPETPRGGPLLRVHRATPALLRHQIYSGSFCLGPDTASFRRSLSLGLSLSLSLRPLRQGHPASGARAILGGGSPGAAAEGGAEGSTGPAHWRRRSRQALDRVTGPGGGLGLQAHGGQEAVWPMASAAVPNGGAGHGGSSAPATGPAPAPREGARELIRVGGQEELVEVSAGPGVSAADLRAVLSSGPLKQWLDQMAAPNGLLPLSPAPAPSAPARAAAPHEAMHCRLNSILVQGVDFFGKRPGFVKFKADLVDVDSGAKLPGIVFARGGAVGVLMLLRAQDDTGAWDTYALLTEQVRVPAGRVLLELPAGMLDDDGTDFVGSAAREVEEETGIHIRVADLVDLTALLSLETGQKMLPSPGGCDEGITLFLYRAFVDWEVIRSLQGRQTGLREHGELIRVRAVPLKGLWRRSPDSKVLCALALYECALREGLLPDTFLIQAES